MSNKDTEWWAQQCEAAAAVARAAGHKQHALLLLKRAKQARAGAKRLRINACRAKNRHMIHNARRPQPCATGAQWAQLHEEELKRVR